MRRNLTTIGAVIVAFGLGFVLYGSTGSSDSSDGSVSPEPDIPAAAMGSWFPPAEQYDNGGEPLSEESFDELMSALDVAMTADETLEDFDREADFHLWNFIRRLSVPEVSEEQQERTAAYLDALAEEHPDSRETIERKGDMLTFYAAAMPTMSPFVGYALSAPGVYERPGEGEPFTEAHMDRMLAGLDAVLALPEATADFERGARVSLFNFAYSLQRTSIDEEQTARMVTHLEELKGAYPGAAETLGEVQFMVEHLLPGRVAPNITGKDTEGVEFALEDYRGNIVAVIFSGQWCGPCRGEYPYQRAMLKLFEDRDVALLGVNSDAKLETIVEAKKEEGLHYRTWWDGHSQPDAEVTATEGPIATEWGVFGWPTIFVLDEEGVIRHVDKRGGALIEAVDKLLMEKSRREYREQAEAKAAAETDEADSETDKATSEADEAAGRL